MHCRVNLEASHEESGVAKHYLLFKACGWGHLTATGKEVGDGTGHCQHSPGRLTNPDPLLPLPATLFVCSRCPPQLDR